MNYSIKKLDEKSVRKIKEYLLQNDFYSEEKGNLVVYKKQNITITIYTTGTILFQGKEGKDWYQEIQLLLGKSIAIEEPLLELPKIGSDESGKGDFFGPLVTSAVLIKNKKEITFLQQIGVKDSKKISDKKAKELAGKIKKRIKHDIVLITPTTYNKLYSQMNNLNKLLIWSHSKAIENVIENEKPELIIIDKFCSEEIMLGALRKKDIKISVKQIPRAEKDTAVAAASILARAEFLIWLEKCEEKMGLNLPKGASNLVIDAGRKIVKEHGVELLGEVCKTHFKTYKKILAV